MADSQYVRPYVESSVFVSWVKGETDIAPGATETMGTISARILKQAEDGIYRIVTSYLTIAEVFKKRGDGRQRLQDSENGVLLKYFEHEFFMFVEVDRGIAEEANKLCRLYREHKLMPCDAIHLACALRARCEVVLTWDKDLWKIQHPGIRIETPRILGQGLLPISTT